MTLSAGGFSSHAKKVGEWVKEESLPALEPGSTNGLHADASISGFSGRLAVKCPNCKELLVHRDFEKNLEVCLRCGHHFRLTAWRRVELTADEDSFENLTPKLQSDDPLHFVSRSESYKTKLDTQREATGLDDAVLMGRIKIEGTPAIIAVMDFSFIGGSMGSVAGEVLTQAIERAATERLPVIIFTASGGARMQEGMIALMQMAKTTAALHLLAKAETPFISVLTDPTTGGVAASFTFLGDIMLAEPNALIGFAGPRVIEQFMHQRLPKDVNTSEFVLLHGMIDAVVPRRAMRPTLARLLRLYQANTSAQH